MDSVWVSSLNDTVTCADTGTYQATIYAQDPSGNIDSCVSTLTVIDDIDPTIICFPGFVYINDQGFAAVDTTGLIFSLGDNCGIDSVWVDELFDTLQCADTGTFSAIIHVSDLSGNESICFATITVVDTTSPSITCNPGTIYLDNNGNATIDTTGLINILDDNCSVNTVSIDPSDANVTCTDTGVHLVTINVTDVSGNTTTCVSAITVLDTTNATISCSSLTAYLDADGVISIDTTGLINSFGDNCSIDSVWLSDANDTLTCADTGTYLVYSIRFRCFWQFRQLYFYHYRFRHY